MFFRRRPHMRASAFLMGDATCRLHIDQPSPTACRARAPGTRLRHASARNVLRKRQTPLTCARPLYGACTQTAPDRRLTMARTTSQSTRERTRPGTAPLRRLRPASACLQAPARCRPHPHHERHPGHQPDCLGHVDDASGDAAAGGLGGRTDTQPGGQGNPERQAHRGGYRRENRQPAPSRSRSSHKRLRRPTARPTTPS